MRGIETAFWGVLGKDPELRTSRTGKPFATMNIVVTVCAADDGKEVTQWIRVACFGETAEKIAAVAKKSDRVYVEGSLSVNEWNDAQGERRTGLNVAAFKIEKVPAIGRNRPRREKEPSTNGTPSFAGTVYQREKPHVQGRDRFDFDDEIPFGRQ